MFLSLRGKKLIEKAPNKLNYIFKIIANTLFINNPEQRSTEESIYLNYSAA